MLILGCCLLVYLSFSTVPRLFGVQSVRVPFIEEQMPARREGEVFVAVRFPSGWCLKKYQSSTVNVKGTNPVWESG